MDFSSPLFADDAIKWRAQYDLWQGTRDINDIYLECVWDLESREQSEFRRDELLRKRALYWADVAEPLVQAETDL